MEPATTSSTRSITVNAAPPVGGSSNVALGKSATVDSEYNATYTKGKAVDGDISTTSSNRWVSANTAWPHWIELDLNGTYSINQLKFWTGSDGYNRSVHYTFEYWNGTGWSTLLNKPSNTDPTVDETFTAVTTSKVRLTGTGTSDGAGNLFRLFEVEVHGTTVANTAPVISLSAPANNAAFTVGQNVTATASASDADGTISKVEFFSNGSKLGEDNFAPYNFTWTALSAGTYAITAKATDNGGATTTSSVKTITVSEVSVGNTNLALGKTTTVDSEYNSTYTKGKAVDGNIGTGSNTRWVSANTSWPHWIEVDLAGTYTINQLKFWTGSGGYNRGVEYRFEYWNGTSWTTIIDKPNNTDPTVDETFTAVTTNKVRLFGTGGQDNIFRLYEIEVYGGSGGGSTNQAPTVSLTAPANNSTFTAGQSITLTANASDADGTIAKVEFYRGNTRLGEDVSAPYSFEWTNAFQGSTCHHGQGHR